MKSPGFWGQKRHLSCNSNAWFLAAANFSLCWKPCNIWSRNTVQPRCLDTCNCPSRSCNKVVWFGSRVVLRSTICAKLFYAPRSFTTQKMEDEKMKCQLHMRTVCCFFSLLSFILIIDPNWNLSSKRDYTRYKPCKINWPKIDWVILTCPKIFSVWCLSFKCHYVQNASCSRPLIQHNSRLGWKHICAVFKGFTLVWILHNSMDLIY